MSSILRKEKENSCIFFIHPSQYSVVGRYKIKKRGKCIALSSFYQQSKNQKKNEKEEKTQTRLDRRKEEERNIYSVEKQGPVSRIPSPSQIPIPWYICTRQLQFATTNGQKIKNVLFPISTFLFLVCSFFVLRSLFFLLKRRY